jgi:hypothetical protein
MTVEYGNTVSLIFCCSEHFPHFLTFLSNMVSFTIIQKYIHRIYSCSEVTSHIHISITLRFLNAAATPRHSRLLAHLISLVILAKKFKYLQYFRNMKINNYVNIEYKVFF